MKIEDARALFGEAIVIQLYNLCPGCGEDNMPLPFAWLSKTALTICPKCGTDRTPGPEYCDEDEFI